MAYRLPPRVTTQHVADVANTDRLQYEFLTRPPPNIRLDPVTPESFTGSQKTHWTQIEEKMKSGGFVAKCQDEMCFEETLNAQLHMLNGLHSSLKSIAQRFGVEEQMDEYVARNKTHDLSRTLARATQPDAEDQPQVGLDGHFRLESLGTNIHGTNSRRNLWSHRQAKVYGMVAPGVMAN